MPFRLEGKVALITGGSGTIGLAIAKAFLSEGARIILTARRLSKLEEAKHELMAVHRKRNCHRRDDRIYIIPSDISKEENVVELFTKIDTVLGTNSGKSNIVSSNNVIDIVVNNAGINVAAQTTENLTAADMESVLGVNVIGSFLCAREAMKRMIRRGKQHGGRIINIGSISAISPRSHSAAYTTSKFALQGLTHSLALDGRVHGISVGIIHPGNVISDMLSPEVIEMRGRTEGFLRAEDVAECVLTMATLPHSSNVLEMTVIPTTQPLVGRG
jgi:NAD(P)-dependent dehydrogenase (short-subunit alcohol dehydrogenase family)